QEFQLTLDQLELVGPGAPQPSGVAALERALWGIGSTHEKIQALLALVLGTPAFRTRKGRGAPRFRPRRDDNRAALRKLGEPDATSLLEIEARLNSHRALLLRHQLSHGLAPLTAHRPLGWVEIIRVHRGGPIDYGANQIYSERSFGPEEASLTPDDAYGRAR